MKFDLQGAFVHTLRLCAVALLITVAWQTSVAAQGGSPDSQPAEEQLKEISNTLQYPPEGAAGRE